MGVRVALSTKLQQGKLVILDKDSLESHKTKQFQEIVNKFGWKSALLITGGDQIDENLRKASSNIPTIHVRPKKGLTVYEILRRDVLVLSKESLDYINKTYNLWKDWKSEMNK